MAYAVFALADIIYSVLSAANANELFSAMSDMCGALVISGIMIEGVVWTMVMALGILAEAKGRARAEGREEGREEERLELLQALREDGLSEDRIQRIMDRLDARTKGARES